MSLCQICARFSFQTIRDQEFPHHATLNSLRDSAQAGCPLCRLINNCLTERFQRLREANVIDKEPESQVTIEMWPSPNTELLGGPAELTVKAYAGDTRLAATLDVSAAFGDPAAAFVTTRTPYPSSSCNEVFAHLTDWMQFCSTEYPTCQRRMSRLPTRVIDVGPLDGSKDPRLVVSNGAFGEYLALSYCWGNYPALTTTESNFHAHCNGIGLLQLPATIKDAVTITRRLQFKYLWVDALCIIQGSKQDWEAESVKMASVYGNAYLTIVAEAASHCGEGIFLDRPPIPGVVLPFCLRDGSPCGNVTISQRNRWDALHRTTHLGSRGWTFQEKILSCRTVHYYRDSTVFRCRIGKAHERYGFSQQATPFENLASRMGASRTPEIYSHRLEELLDQWYRDVQDYSPRELTKQSDRLPALFGLAHAAEMAMPIDSHYMAGIWDCDLAYGLTWKTMRTRGHTAAGLPRSSPTWSWVSVAEPVLYERSWTRASELRNGSCRAISDIDSSSITTDSFGDIVGGFLRIKAPLQLVRRQPGTDIMYVPSLLARPQGAFAVPMAPETTTASSSSSSTVASENTIPSLYGIFDDDSEQPVEVYCLLLLATRGIMLSRSGPTSSTYRRVGYFELDVKVVPWTTVSTVEII